MIRVSYFKCWWLKVPGYDAWCLPRVHCITPLYSESLFALTQNQSQEEKQTGGSGSKQVAGNEAVLQSSSCSQRRKHHHFTKVCCKLQIHFSDQKRNLSKPGQSRSLALYTWAAQTLFVFPGSSIKQWDEKEASILLC